METKKSYGPWFHIKETDSIECVLSKIERQIKQHEKILQNLKDLKMTYTIKFFQNLPQEDFEQMEEGETKELLRKVRAL